MREATSDDRFLAEVGKDAECVAPGEIVLAAGSRVLTRRWTWRQAGDTRISPETCTVFFDIDGLPPTSGEDVAAAIVDAIELVGRYCGGRCIGHAILDAGQPSATFQID